MDTPSIRERAVSELEKLRDEDIAEVLELMLLLQAETEHLAGYDPSQDPVLTGEDLFEGPGDLSSRDEELLYGDDPHDNG